MRFGIFDLGSFFWTLAGTRSKEEGSAALALQVLRYMRERASKSEVDVVVLASDGPPEAPSRSWRLRVDPGYKSQRAPKDEAQRAELVALVGALEDAGFPVVAVMEQNEPTPAMPGWGSPVWFEADDVAYSVAKKVASSSTETLKFEAYIFSNDWDLAQVLAVPGDWKGTEHWENCVRLFTTRGEERAPAGVEREFGVGPAKLAELKALAGDPSDGYKPFPGEAPGKPGIGDKGAADILKAFGSAHSAMAAALSDLDLAFQQKGLPKRLPALLRKGGEEALERGLKLAALRGDAPVPDVFDVGDWEEAEAALLARQTVSPSLIGIEGALARGAIALHQTEASSPIGCAGATPKEADEEGQRIVEEVNRGSLTSRTAQKIVAEIEAAGSAEEREGGTLEDLGRVVDVWKAEDEALPPAERAKREREAEKLDRALAPKTERVLLTEAEFWAVAPLPAAWAAGLLRVPPDVAVELDAFVRALSDGDLRSMPGRQAFVGDLSAEAERGLRLVAELASNSPAGARVAEDWGEGWDEFFEDLKALPHFCALAYYGRPLVRAAK